MAAMPPTPARIMAYVGTRTPLAPISATVAMGTTAPTVRTVMMTVHRVGADLVMVTMLGNALQHK